MMIIQPQIGIDLSSYPSASWLNDGCRASETNIRLEHQARTLVSVTSLLWHRQ
jgi:hypothetical protein